MSSTRGLRFSKMHGAGNDFVMLDRRGLDRNGMTTPLDPALAIALGNRHTGVGCDQIITIEDPRSTHAVAYYGIWNSDGSASQQCGNGARCVASWLIRDGITASTFTLDSPAGPMQVTRGAHDAIAINMGAPDFSAAAVGLDAPAPAEPHPVGLHHLLIDGEDVAFGVVSMGNPHAVIEVADVSAAPVARVGAALQHHAAFRQSCNVGFAQVLTPAHIRLRVNERGAGETLACGSGACAAVAELARRGRVGTHVAVDLPGGTLHISWAGPDAPIWMAGPTAFVFEGEFIA